MTFEVKEDGYNEYEQDVRVDDSVDFKATPVLRECADAEAPSLLEAVHRLRILVHFTPYSFSTGHFRPGSFWPFWAPPGPIRPLSGPWLGAQGLRASDGLDLRSIGGFQTPFRTDFRSGFLADLGMYRWSVV